MGRTVGGGHGDGRLNGSSGEKKTDEK